MTEHKVKTTTTTYTHTDGRPMSKSDRRWYIGLSFVSGVSVTVTLAVIAVILALGGWGLIALCLVMIAVGFIFIDTGARIEQRNIERKRLHDLERERRRSRNRTDSVVS